MIHAVDPDDDDVPGSRPDLLFAIAVGLYSALLLAPAVSGLLALVFTNFGIQLLVSVLGGQAFVAGMATLVRRYRVSWKRLGDGRRSWLPTILPLPVSGTVLVGYLLVTDGRPSEAVVVGLFLVVIATFVVGLALTLMVQRRHADALVSNAEVLAKWSAPLPSRERRARKTLGIVLVLAGACILVVGIVWESVLVRGFAQLFVAGGIASNVLDSGRTYRVTAVGLERHSPQRRLLPWSRFDGYEVTDDALVIRFDDPLGFSVRFDRAEIRDGDAVLGALSDHLDRRESPPGWAARLLRWLSA